MYERKIEEVWGSRIVERLSIDLKSAFPSAKGFSTTNLWYIKKWYIFYSQEVKKLHQVGGELSLSRNIERFLLELGKGFAFVGRQVELRVSDTSYYVDMLFYHIRLKSYIVVELKSVDFKPEFVGKLNFYVNAVDNLLRHDDDNQTIGLLICHGKDNTKVEWSFKGLETPLGITEYKLETYKSVLPTIEEMESGLISQ